MMEGTWKRGGPGPEEAWVTIGGEEDDGGGTRCEDVEGRVAWH